MFIGSTFTADRIRRNGSHLSRWWIVSSRRRSVSTASFSGCGSEYCSSDISSSSCMELRQRVVFDLAGGLHRELVDVADRERACVQAEPPGDLATQIVRRRVRPRGSPQHD